MGVNCTEVVATCSCSTPMSFGHRYMCMSMALDYRVFKYAYDVIITDIIKYKSGKIPYIYVEEGPTIIN